MQKRKLLKALKCTLILFVLLIIYCVLGELSLRYFDDDYVTPKNYFYVSNECHKAVLLIPHQDDDLFVAGPLTYNLRNRNVETKVLFFTDGDSHEFGDVRQKEAFKANKVLGVPNEDVVCLQFPNRRQSDTTDASGVSSEAVRSQMKERIKKEISAFHPQLIVSVDFDFHRDHRLVSLLFDESIGELLKEDKSYKPVILKGFSYQTSYNAIKDFYDINLKSTQIPQEVQNVLYETDVPAYAWDARVRIPVEGEMLTHATQTNLLYHALEEYRSVWVRDKTPAIINGDNVFWIRRADNMLLHAAISASSGNTKYLNDFRLYNSNDITIRRKYDVEFEDFLWEAASDDSLPAIHITLDSPRFANQLVLYDDPQFNKQIISADLYINGTYYQQIGALHDNGTPTPIPLDYPERIESMDILNIRSNIGTPALAELELVNQHEHEYANFSVIKIKNKRTDDFLYKYYVSDREDSINLSAYVYGVDSQKIKWELINDDNSHAKLRDGTITFGDKFHSCKVRAYLAYSPLLYDEVDFMKEEPFDRFMYSFMTSYDRLKLGCETAFYRNRVVGGIIRHSIFNPIKRLFR